MELRKKNNQFNKNGQNYSTNKGLSESNVFGNGITTIVNVCSQYLFICCAISSPILFCFQFR